MRRGRHKQKLFFVFLAETCNIIVPSVLRGRMVLQNLLFAWQMQTSLIDQFAEKKFPIHSSYFYFFIKIWKSRSREKSDGSFYSGFIIKILGN